MNDTGSNTLDDEVWLAIDDARLLTRSQILQKFPGISPGDLDGILRRLETPCMIFRQDKHFASTCGT